MFSTLLFQVNNISYFEKRSWRWQTTPSFYGFFSLLIIVVQVTVRGFAVQTGKVVGAMCAKLDGRGLLWLCKILGVAD